MACPHCGSAALDHQDFCPDCGASPALEAPTDIAPPATDPAEASDATRSVGPVLGPRYRIVGLLGAGGMGTVYHAWDNTLEIPVAVKLIRTPPTADPATAPALKRRLKHELLMARQVSHRNVVRIHDLGEVDGVAYITMTYIQGSDLGTILKREGKLPISRALALARQVASGLVAAHDVGVIHRDLKPANIMVDDDGHALITDFGLARSASPDVQGAVTLEGGIVGTVDYMAPEQAQGLTVDRRADIYSFGLMLNDMLLGRRQADSGKGMPGMLARMQHAPPSLRSIDPAIPPWIDTLVTKCLQPDPSSRYSTIAEVLTELESLDPDPAGRGVQMPALVAQHARMSAPRPFAAKRWIVGACVGLAFAAAGWALRDRWLSPVRPSLAADLPISLAILPFHNASGDPALDSLGVTISELLISRLGGSSYLRTVSLERLYQMLEGLEIEWNAALGAPELAILGEAASARHVLSGRFARLDNGIRLDATLQDRAAGQSVQLFEMAREDAGLLTAITQLGVSIGEHLARGSVTVSDDLRSTPWSPPSHSLMALRLYYAGRLLKLQGKHPASLESFASSVTLDGSFALALSALAESYALRDSANEAERFSLRAMNLSDRLPAADKYLVSSVRYQILDDQAKVLESYENLVKVSPNNSTFRAALAGSYERNGRLDEAFLQFAKAVELDPTYADAVLGLARLEIRRGNMQASLPHLDRARALAIQFKSEEARANVLQAIGIAYLRLNRPEEALRRFEESLESKRKRRDKRGIAASVVQIATTYVLLGKPHEAEPRYQEAVMLRRELGDRPGLSRTLMELAALYSDQLPRPADALQLLQEALVIARETGDLNLEALVLNNLGRSYLALRSFADAQIHFQRSLQLREKANSPQGTADTLHSLALTLTRMGRYDQALSRHRRALELRSAAGDRRSGTYDLYEIGELLDYQGQFGAALKAKGEALQTLRDLGAKDVWLGEVLAGYGKSLTLSGRLAEAAGSLEEALSVAQQHKNETLAADTLRLQLDRLYYSGDVEGASALIERAAQAAARTLNPRLELALHASTARTGFNITSPKARGAKLADLERDAEGMNASASRSRSASFAPRAFGDVMLNPVLAVLAWRASSSLGFKVRAAACAARSMSAEAPSTSPL